MRLRPPEFEVNPDSPYERDRLGRQPRVEALCELLANVDGAAVVSVNGGFGSGKSAFLRMCAASLRLRGVLVVEFDAWQEGHTGKPLVDLISALAQKSSGWGETLRRIAASLAWRAAGVATKGIIVREDHVEIKDASEFGEWADTDERKVEFKKVMAEMVEANRGRVVVLIDELDRCRPENAVEMLSVVRHLLDVPGVLVVLGVNRTELCHRIRTVYGAECDAETFLNRFADFAIDLEDPALAMLKKFLDGVLAEVDKEERIFPHEWRHSGEMIYLLAQQTETSLRDIEQMVHRAAHMLRSIAGPTYSEEKEHSALTMMVLREIDRDVYEQFTAGQCDAFDAAAALQRGMSARVSDPLGWEVTGSRMKAILMLLTDEDGLAAADNKEKDFIRRYVDAGLGDAVKAETVYGTTPLASVDREEQNLAIRSLADLVELFA